MEDLLRLWDVSERLGFDWISVWDHFYAAQIPRDRPCFEAVACHGALAARTSKVRVGCLVYCAAYRNPAVLANAAVTVDHISRGRLELGLGAGWHADEFQGYGIPFEPPATRLRRLAETIEVIRLLFTESEVSYDGEFITLTEAVCNPKPVQAQPRIWVGASGDKLALPLAGRLADGWNIAYVSPEEFGRKLGIVKRHSPAPDRLVTGVNVGLVFADSGADEELARRFGAYADRVKEGTLYGGVGQIVEKIGRYQQAGADWINLGLRAPFDIASLERFATEVIPQVTDPR